MPKAIAAPTSVTTSALVAPSALARATGIDAGRIGTADCRPRELDRGPITVGSGNEPRSSPRPFAPVAASPQPRPSADSARAGGQRPPWTAVPRPTAVPAGTIGAA